MTDETREIVDMLRGVAEEMALLRSSAYEGDLPIIEEAGDVAEMAANKIERLSAEVERLRGEPESPDSMTIPGVDRYARRIMEIADGGEPPLRYEYVPNGDVPGLVIGIDGPTPSAVAVNGETYLPADGGERVEVAIRGVEANCSCAGAATWEVDVDCGHWTAGDRAAAGCLPATLILHPRDTETSDE